MTNSSTVPKDKIGIIVGGGPAPGINGVISAAVIEAVNNGKEVIGIVDGFKSLLNGEKNFLPLTINDVSQIHSTGGSILHTSRDTAENSQAKLDTLINTLKSEGIKNLITIGGDGTLHMANLIEKESRGEINVVHTPKTIDNDIPLPGGFSTFGYQTARHVGVSIINNIIEDAHTTGRWYFITVMGRHAGHLALGTCEASGATLALIPEEFETKKLCIQKVADTLTGSIIKRLSMGRNYGTAILAEGISERFDIEELEKYTEIKHNEKGDIKLSELHLGEILKQLVHKNLEEMGIKAHIVDKKIGYELRAADPIPFDIEYTRYLGYGAVRYLLNGDSGVMITFYDGNIKPIPFVEMIDPKTGKMKIRTVDIHSETYGVARKYMIRLEKEDFCGNQINKLAQITNIQPEEFKRRFEYILDNHFVC